MANIASVFHWPLSEMDAMTLTELADWHARAMARVPGQNESAR
ncbi:MAG: GpE family phage tail protein [Pseudomonadota bacterium]